MDSRNRSRRSSKSSGKRNNRQGKKTAVSQGSHSLYHQVRMFANQIGLKSEWKILRGGDDEFLGNPQKRKSSLVDDQPLHETKIFESFEYLKHPSTFDLELEFQKKGQIDSDVFWSTIPNTRYEFSNTEEALLDRPKNACLSLDTLREMNFSEWRKDDAKYLKMLRIKYSQCTDFMLDMLSIAKQK
ncbi:hypothetical protein ACOME3_000966 [Neoechinorhynchus agilis]